METQLSSYKGAQRPNFRPMSVVAKRLDRLRFHLVWSQASAHVTLCSMGTHLPRFGWLEFNVLFSTNTAISETIPREKMGRAPSIFGRPFVKRFAVCYRTVVLSCLSCLSVCDVRALWTNGWTDQDETWRARRPRAWPHCVR